MYFGNAYEGMPSIYGVECDPLLYDFNSEWQELDRERRDYNAYYNEDDFDDSREIDVDAEMAILREGEVQRPIPSNPHNEWQEFLDDLPEDEGSGPDDSPAVGKQFNNTAVKLNRDGSHRAEPVEQHAEEHESLDPDPDVNDLSNGNGNAHGSAHRGGSSGSGGGSSSSGSKQSRSGAGPSAQIHAPANLISAPPDGREPVKPPPVPAVPVPPAVPGLVLPANVPGSVLSEPRNVDEAWGGASRTSLRSLGSHGTGSSQPQPQQPSAVYNHVTPPSSNPLEAVYGPAVTSSCSDKDQGGKQDDNHEPLPLQDENQNHFQTSFTFRRSDRVDFLASLYVTENDADPDLLEESSGWTADIYAARYGVELRVA